MIDMNMGTFSKSPLESSMTPYSNPGKEFRPLQYKQRMVQSVALRIT
jgi:hypothetical protein